MTSTAPERRYTFREYLELEASSDRRYEFFDGAVYAMSGGSPEHSGLAANVIQLLGAQLAGKPAVSSRPTCGFECWRPAWPPIQM